MSTISRIANAKKYESNKENYTVVKLNNSTKAKVIGIIKINTIGIEYPILSETTNELLKIAPCKFFGSEPNKVGNLCIAGHNFNDERFFSKLSSLKIGDVIEIYAPANVCVYYEVFDMYEIEKNDLIIKLNDMNPYETLEVNIIGNNIEIETISVINEEIEGILDDLEINTILKEEIDSIIFSDLSIKKKRIGLRKLRKSGLEPKYINMFIGLLEFIENK